MERQRRASLDVPTTGIKSRLLVLATAADKRLKSSQAARSQTRITEMADVGGRNSGVDLGDLLV